MFVRAGAVVVAFAFAVGSSLVDGSLVADVPFGTVVVVFPGASVVAGVDELPCSLFFLSFGSSADLPDPFDFAVLSSSALPVFPLSLPAGASEFDCVRALLDTLKASAMTRTDKPCFILHSNS